MRKFGVLLWVGVFIALTVNGQGGLGHAMSSREVVKQQLERMGVKVGCDAAGGRMVAVATRGYSLKDDESNNANNDFGMTETYDFSDDASDDVEMRHFKALWKAYADCLSTIASYQGLSIAHEEKKDDAGNVLSETMTSAATSSLGGVAFLTMAESLDDDGWCEVTVAVGQSKKREEAYLRGVNGGDSRPGKYALDEWVKQKSESGSGIICPQAYCDNEGVWWRVASVPVDLSEGRNSKEGAGLTEKAKRYACQAAMRALAVRVSTSTSQSVFNKSYNGSEQKGKTEKTVKIDPINTVLPVDPSQVRWFELERMNPLTGNPVRCVVAALRSGNSKNVAAESASVPARADVRESTKAKQITANDRQMDAEEQAHRFCMENGLELGFNSEKRVITLVSSGRFDYEPQMSDEEFARKRYLTFQRALMWGGGEISEKLERMREDRSGVYRPAYPFMLGRFVDDEEDESWISQLMGQMLGREFSWRTRLVGSRGTAIINCSLWGLSIVRQFESLSEDRYQVALIISLDVEKGKNEIMSFYDGKPAPPGKMSLRQWMDAQDFGVVVGPRRFVDNEGTIWALGVVPAAEGQQPYGTLLDAAARECAAFAFGGELSVSINEGDPVHSITGSGDKAGDSGNSKNGSFIGLKAIGTGVYPRELEQYFRRPYTHPLTGRKGVVAICALRSGSVKASREIYTKKIEETRERQFEEGMRTALRKQLKTLVNELDKVNADDYKMKMRVGALRREISRFEGELQRERSLRKKNRERTTKKLVELRRKVLELKGGKDNEE